MDFIEGLHTLEGKNKIFIVVDRFYQIIIFFFFRNFWSVFGEPV